MAILGAGLFPARGAAQEAKYPIPPDVVDAWRKIGAVFGWQKDGFGSHGAMDARGYSIRYGIGAGKAGELPLIHVRARQKIDFAKLPPPPVDFVLSFARSDEDTKTDLKDLLRFKQLRVLDLSETNGFSNVAALAGLPNLETLILAGARIAETKQLAVLTQLRTLDLTEWDLDADEVKLLAPLKRLRALKLARARLNRVNDDTFKELALFKELRVLDLTGADLELGQVAGGLKPLAELKQLEALSLAENLINDDGLHDILVLENLKELDLSRTSIGDASLKNLARLKKLEHLRLYKTPVTQTGLRALAVLPSLRTLDLGATKTTDAGAKELAALKELRLLSLFQTEVTDSGLKELAALEQMQVLDLDSCELSDKGLKGLAGLKHLHLLSLARTQVTDAGLKELGALQALESLDLWQCKKVTRAGLKDLNALPRLGSLNVSMIPITDEDLPVLAGLKPLRWVSFSAGKVTEKGVRELRASRADLQLQTTYP